ncbi:MAG: DEAD/DEAH box helicase [Bdellovibrionales bacterium]|nr:DEAD/DEAH box helicase [Bdellovibrionales bacterium]
MKYFYPIQYHTFALIIRGYDLVGRDKTGSGKTIAYTLPILQRFRHQNKNQNILGQQHPYPKYLIILPTRELTIQVTK